MLDQIDIKESGSFHQLSVFEPMLTKLGYLVEIDRQFISLYKEEWKKTGSNIPSLGLLKMRSDFEKPYYLFGVELLQSRHYKDLKTAFENLLLEAHK